jgi:hypothetical protein
MDCRTFQFYILKGQVHNLHKTPSEVLSQPKYVCMQMLQYLIKVCPRTLTGVGNDVRGQKLSEDVPLQAFNCQLQIKKKIFLPLKITVTVRGRNSRGLLLSAYVPPAEYYCPRTYLPRTITVRGSTCHGLLLSADILAADYNCRVQKGGIGPSNSPSTCFLQDHLS